MNIRDIILARAMGGGSGGSSGGGSASIDVTASVGQTIVVEEVDANGKPTKWKAADFQEKICGSEEILVCEETTVDLSNEGYFVALALPRVGGICKVKYNGAEYTSTAVDCSAQAGFECVMLGNSALALGTGDTGEPFSVMLTRQGGEVLGYLVFLDGAETATLSIRGETVTKIPFEYIPDATKACLIVLETDDDGNIYTTNVTPKYIAEQIGLGRTIITDLAGSLCYLTYKGDNAFDFSAIRYTGVGFELINVYLRAEDENSLCSVEVISNNI